MAFFTSRADALKIHITTQNLIAALRADNILNSNGARSRIQGNIIHLTAGDASNMRVICHHGIESSLSVTHVKPPDPPTRRELIEVSIYCSEADPRESRFNHLVDIVCCRMGFHLTQLFKENPLLLRHPLLSRAHMNPCNSETITRLYRINDNSYYYPNMLSSPLIQSLMKNIPEKVIHDC
jgi:hypothetical protein